MITMKDWLRLRRKGVNLFDLSEENLVILFANLNLEIDDFVTELSRFFVGNTQKDSAKNDGNDSEQKQSVTRIRDEVVWSIVSQVEGWQDLTWNECVSLYTAKMEAKSREVSQLLCMIHNAHCSRRQDLKSPADFDAFAIAKATAEKERLRREYQVITDDERLSEFLRKG